MEMDDLPGTPFVTKPGAAPGYLPNFISKKGCRNKGLNYNKSQKKCVNFDRIKRESTVG